LTAAAILEEFEKKYRTLLQKKAACIQSTHHSQVHSIFLIDFQRFLFKECILVVNHSRVLNPQRAFKSKVRWAFTLTELLASIAIIGLLLAILLPAVQSARESARRTQCRSNLRQIGVALHNYEALWKTFPACGVMGVSWEVAILPQIDQAALYRLVDLMAEDRTAKLRETSVKLYVCPSDGAPEIFHGAVTVAATSYLGNSGTGALFKSPNGVFNHFYTNSTLYTESAVTYADVTDGLSATAAVSECLHSMGFGSSDRLRFAWNLPQEFSASETESFVTMCQSIPAEPWASGWGGDPFSHGFEWVFGDIGSSTYNHMLVPMQPSCMNGTSVQSGIYSAGSAHQSHVNVLFCDGHVQQVTSSVDVKLWRAIGSRNGSESIQF